MKKKKERILISLMLILTILILIVIGIIINIEKDEGVLKETLAEDEIDTSEEYTNYFDVLKNKQEYINISESLNKFISAINQNSSTYYGYDKKGNYTNIVQESVINTNIYNILSEQYIKEKQITVENVKQHMYTIKQKCFYIPINIYKKAESENIKVYAIYGVIINTKYEPMMESYIILNLDENNNTFSVQKLNNKEEFNTIEIDKISSIDKKLNNIYKVSGQIEANLITNYITNYKRLSLAYPEIIYNNYIDEEYREEKFGSIEEYKKYVEDNKDKIKAINIEQYSIEEKEDYTQYICVDQNERYYILKTTSANDYKILLDTYTIDMPQFIEKYDKANSIDKVGYNIQKCIDAINNSDYSYVYNKLDETFKTNNYKTEEEFIKVIKQNLFEKNTISYNSSTNEGYICIYNISVTNKENTEESTNMTVIMKLLDNRDFVMSFSFEQ